MPMRGAQWEIRLVDEGDVESVLDVYRECEDFLALGPQPKASIEMVISDMKASQHDGRSYCGIWNCAGKMIGVLDFVTELNGHAGFAFIELLMIAKPYRNRKIGLEVVTVLENALRNGGRTQIVLSAVQSNNDPAIAFWRKLGYDIVSQPEPQPDGTTTYRLRKELAEP